MEILMALDITSKMEDCGLLACGKMTILMLESITILVMRIICISDTWEVFITIKAREYSFMAAHQFMASSIIVHVVECYCFQVESRLKE